MIALRKPSPSQICDFLAAQSLLAVTYQSESGLNGAPTGYVLDHTRVCLGQGAAVFQAAKAALEAWRQFDLGWVEAHPADTLIRVGNNVAIIARNLGLWWLNAARIVSFVDRTR